jgi:O-antigen/teichoic acid export membrane protein
VAAQALLTVTHVLLARLYGRAVFGGYQAALAILEVLTRGGTGGADKGMLRYVAGQRALGRPDLVRSALGTGLRLCLAIAGCTALALALFAAPPLARVARDPALATALRVMAPAMVFTGCMWVLVQASLAAKVTRANFLVRGLGEPILLLAGGLLAALAGRSLLHLAAGHVIATALTLLLAVVVVGRVFGPGELGRALGSPGLPGFARFSIPLGLGDLMNAILQRADVVLLTMFVGPASTAVYAAAEFITRVIANSRYVFDSVAAPVFSEALHLGQRDRLRHNLVLMTRWVATVAAPIAATVIVLRRELLWLYGPTFQDGAVALVILAVGHLVNAALGLCGWIPVAGGRSRMLLANNAVAAAVNVALGLLLIPRLGLTGTAVAALGSVTLIQIITVVEVRIIHGILPFDRNTAKPFLAAALSGAVEQTIAHNITTPALRVPLVIAAGLASYAAALLLLRLAPEEKHILNGLLRRLGFGRS